MTDGLVGVDECSVSVTGHGIGLTLLLEDGSVQTLLLPRRMGEKLIEELVAGLTELDAAPVVPAAEPAARS